MPLGATPWPPFERATVARKDGTAIDVYLIARADKPRPTLVVLPGSHCVPLFMMQGDRRVSPLMFQAELPKASERMNIVLVERPGLKSFGPPPRDRNEIYRCTETKGGLTKASRVEDVVRVLEALRATPWTSTIHVIGHSQGADVAAGVARAVRGQGIASVGLMAGAGITRFFEEITLARTKEGSDGAARVVREMIAVTGPKPPAEYGGTAVIREISYSVDSTPADDLRGLRVPLFVAAGDRDDHVPAAGADAFVAELLRDPEQDIHYLLLPGLDHGFYDEKGADRSGAVLSAYLDWALKGGRGRTVAVGFAGN